MISGIRMPAAGRRPLCSITRVVPQFQSRIRVLPAPSSRTFSGTGRGALSMRIRQMHTAIQELEKAQLRTDVPDFRAGDTLDVHVRVTEGTRTRVQVFRGVVIRRQGSGNRETFTVRKMSYGVGVERTFPIHSPVIDKYEVIARGRVRRAKLYYLRDLRGKAARIRERPESSGK